MRSIDSLKALLVEFDNIHGVSGDEELISEAISAKMHGVCNDEFVDALGNRFFVKNGSKGNSRIMICSHMDEIGYIVNYIEDSGHLRLAPVGFHDDRMAINQDMLIMTENGPVKGITGAKPAHILTHEEQEKTIPISEVFIDVGMTSRMETESLSIKIGDYVSFDRIGRFLNNGKVYSGKSVDNRSACAVMVEVMHRMQAIEHEADIIAVATVQEEMGMRGGGPAAHRINPDVVVALDVTIAGGTPGIELRQCPVEMGKGPAIKLYDWDPVYGMVGNNVPKKLVKRFITAAENAGVPYQRDVLMGGGTDGWSASLAGNGYLSGVISIPSQYIHTAVGTVNIDDMENMVRLIIQFVSDFRV